MKLFEIYTNEILIPEFWGQLEEDLELNESESGLKELLLRANDIVFAKFKIHPKERKYFIAGSARLYLYPELREAFNLTGSIGDLDIIIPNKEDWIKAGFENEWNEGGIYRPTNDGSIEVFNMWNPAKAGVKYADIKVRPSDQILSEATSIGGYYFMPLKDIMDYKLAMGRDKEQEIVNLINQYRKSGKKDKTLFLRKMINIIGLNNTKKFLGTMD